MRILQLVTDDDRRGAQVFGLALGHELSERGHDVDTVGLAPGREGGLPIPTLGPRRVSRLTLAGVARRAADADVVIGHGSTCLLVGAMVRKAQGSRGPKFVYRQISDPLVWAPSRARRLRVTACYRAVDRVVALAAQPAATLQDCFAVPPERISVIANGVPGEPFQPCDVGARFAAQRRIGIDGRPSLVLAYVGALDCGKGVDIVIRAVLERPEVHLLIAGAGPERAPLEALAAPAGGRITFLGQVDDVAPVLAAADVLALASRTESMPAALIEAGLAGIPVIATRVGAVEEVVVHEATGLLLPPGVPGTVGPALDRLISDEVLRHRLGSAARRRCVENFEMRAVAARWDQVLCELTGEPAVLDVRRDLPVGMTRSYEAPALEGALR